MTAAQSKVGVVQYGLAEGTALSLPGARMGTNTLIVDI